MDACSVAALMPTGEQIKTALSIIGSVVMGASMIVSLTPKPAAGTVGAKFYRVIEVAALLFGRAKETGGLPPTPQVDKALADAVKLVGRTPT